MNDKFHNPYHFVPVALEAEKNNWQPCDLFFKNENNQEGHWSHKRYVDHDYQKNAVYNGRIICRLTTETPIFIGAERIKEPSEEAPGEVQPFELDGRPAIPATSLRGVISSIAEAASNSSLRVLKDDYLSRRMEMRESYKALGLLLAKNGEDKNGELELLPLTLPPMECDAKGQLMRRVPDEWRFVFKYPGLKVYISGYDIDRDGRPCYSKNSFLDLSRPKSFSSTNQELWYLKLGEAAWKNETLAVDRPYIKRIDGKNYKISYFLSGQKSLDNECRPIPSSVYEKKSSEEKKKYTPGILRVLGIDNREADIPGQKSHEIFIPLTLDIKKNKRLDVSDAIRRFHNLADQRTEADNRLPFELHGMKRETKEGKLRLKAFDIVFFDIHEVEGKIVVKDVSLSSIWRKDVGGSVFDYFSGNRRGDNGNDMEFLPFHAERKKISTAEMVFGFVEDRPKSDKEKPKDSLPQARSYASRVRFSHAIFKPHESAEESSPYLPEVTLKILDAPKPPSPALYFTQRALNTEPKYISKQELDPKDHKPHGRKFYLHKLKNDSDPWRSKLTSGSEARLKQKVRITPIPPERIFWFHVDFENLNEYELGMLLYSLSPNDRFRHKIGMGKPLGLGSILIEPVSLNLIKRKQRYRSLDPFSTPRYEESLVINHGAWDQRPERYTAQDSATVKMVPVFPMKNDFEAMIHEDIKFALTTIGNPENVIYPVHTPLQKNQNNAMAEKETFKWFTKNDEKWNRERQFLKPIKKSKHSMPLPPLTRN